MATISLTLLGSFQVLRDGAPVTRFRGDKVRALLAYLAVEAERPHERATLAALFWPEQGDEGALRNLAQALVRLREALGVSDELLHITRQALQWRGAAAQLDVAEFQRLARSEETADLVRAADLYGGEFLAGFGLPDCEAFEEWLLLEREQLHQQALAALHTLAEQHLAAGRFDEAATAARRQLALDRWREDAHRQLMLALALAGDQAAALTAYARCRQTLQDDLGVEPDSETRALYEQIRTGGLPDKETRGQEDKETKRRVSLSPPLPVSLSPRQDWGEVPNVGPLYGRQDEAAQLQHWLLHERCRLIALLGMGGVGKTALAASAVHAVAADFEVVLWHSLLNAPPLDELLREVLQQLEPGAPLNLPGDPEAQIGRLLAALRRSRCLLVLDNLESLLRPNQPGVTRPGYEGYVQLLRAAAERSHQSCVVITSRERPQGMGLLAEDTPLVQLLRLGGLSAEAGAQMLAARGMTATDSAAGELVQRYSGNPLALRLIALTVREVFGGDTRAFLETEAAIFDDIGAVLDQQMARLNPLEQAILFWLAIEREPVSAAALRANLVPQETPRAFLEALRALQQRSLLESVGDGFALQNVLIEYLTERLVAGVCAELLDQDPQSGWLAATDSPTHPLTRSMLDCFALLKAQTREYIRQSQVRLIVQPIADQLVAKLGKARFAAQARALLATLRAAAPLAPGYAAGNLLNLLLHLNIDVSGYDFSRLSIWQADLRRVAMADVNFAQADLRGCAFILTFNTFAILVDRSEQMVLAAPMDSDVCLWKATNGQLQDVFRTPSKGAVRLVFSQDGQFLAGCCLDHTVRLWSVETGATLHIFEGHTEPTFGLAFSDDARLLASSSLDNTLRLWDVRTGRCLQTVSHQASNCPPLAFCPTPYGAHAPDMVVLASGNQNTIMLWDIARGQVIDILRGHTREVQNLAFSPDGSVLASGSHDGMILLWDVRTPGHSRMLGSLQGHSKSVSALVFHPNSAVLASGSADCTIRLWDCSTLRARQILQGHASDVVALDFSADGQTLVSASWERMVRRWDVQTGRALDSLNGYTDTIQAVSFRPDGRQLASGGADGMIRIWESGHGRLERSLRGHAGQVLAVAFSPNAHLLVTGGTDGVIQIWDAASGQSLRTLRGHTGAVRSLAFHPDGKLLASGGADQTIRLWPVADGGAFAGSGARMLHGHTDDVTGVAFSHDGRVLVSCSNDHTLRLWAVERGEPVQRLTGHTAAITAVAFSPDGAWIASIGYDSMVRMWDVATGRSSTGWEEIRAGSRVVAFSPRGDLLAHGAEEVQLVVRDARTGTIIHTLQGHTNTIVGLHWSPTDSILASSGWDGTIRVWDVKTGACLHILRAPGPYAGMNIAGVTGISEAQKASLRALGAVESA
jgi:WD40 repeat protein/DNA-binding SARP family transcriptional activator